MNALRGAIWFHIFQKGAIVQKRLKTLGLILSLVGIAMSAFINCMSALNF